VDPNGIAVQQRNGLLRHPNTAAGPWRHPDALDVNTAWAQRQYARPWSTLPSRVASQTNRFSTLINSLWAVYGVCALHATKQYSWPTSWRKENGDWRPSAKILLSVCTPEETTRLITPYPFITLRSSSIDFQNSSKYSTMEEFISNRSFSEFVPLGFCNDQSVTDDKPNPTLF